jgi:hypothetical protein
MFGFLPYKPFVTREYPRRVHPSVRACLSFGHSSLDDLKSPSGGNWSGQKCHFNRDDNSPSDKTTSLNKSCCLNSVLISEGDLSDSRKGSETINGSKAFHSRVSWTSSSCFLAKTVRDAIIGVILPNSKDGYLLCHIYIHAKNDESNQTMTSTSTCRNIINNQRGSHRFKNRSTTIFHLGNKK